MNCRPLNNINARKFGPTARGEAEMPGYLKDLRFTIGDLRKMGGFEAVLNIPRGFGVRRPDAAFPEKHQGSFAFRIPNLGSYGVYSAIRNLQFPIGR